MTFEVRTKVVVSPIGCTRQKIKARIIGSIEKTTELKLINLFNS